MFKKVKAFKGNEEIDVWVSSGLNECKFKKALITTGGEVQDFCNMLKLEEQMDGFKFKACINCFFFHYFCKDCKMYGSKSYCMPRLHASNKIEKEKNAFMEEAGLKYDSEYLEYFELRRRMVWGGNGERVKKFMFGTESCNNFEYCSQENKITEVDEPGKYLQNTKNRSGKEEKWYWPEKKKEYYDKMKKALEKINLKYKKELEASVMKSKSMCSEAKNGA